MQRLLWMMWVAGLLLTAGCGVSGGGKYLTDTHKENGLVVILPGIEGEGIYNHNIRKGLVSAGCYRAIPIYNWGLPIPGLGLVINQTPLGKKEAAKKIANMIESYQDNYPGRPVYLVGHSGGGGMAVFAAEGLSPGRKIDGLILLSASISSNYNLSKALSHCRGGLVNFYNPEDSALLGLGTAIMGNVDGGHGPSAGLRGFSRAYRNVWQIQLTPQMTRKSGGFAHDAATRPTFVSRYVAPWVLSSRWPPNPALAGR